MIGFDKDFNNLNFTISKLGLLNTEDYINEMLEKYPNSDGVLLKKAQLEQKKNNDKEAEEIYIRVMNKNSKVNSLFAMEQLFKLYIKHNNFEKAKFIYEKTAERCKKENLVSYELSILLRLSEKYNESNDLLIETINNCIKQNDPYVLADCLTEVFDNRTESFRKYNYKILKKAIKIFLNQKNQNGGMTKSKMTIFLAKLELTDGNIQEALKLYRSLENSKYDWVKFHVLYGICKIYLIEGHKDILNTVEFEKLLESEYNTTKYLIIQIYALNNKFEEAFKIIENDPNNIRMKYEKGKIFLQLGKLNDALTIFNECFKNGTCNLNVKAGSILNIINIYVHLHDYENIYNLLLEHKDLIISFDKNYYYQTLAYVSKKLNFKYDTAEYNSYSVNQILNYNIADACTHIKKHVNDFNEVIDFDGDIEKLLIKLMHNLENKIFLNISFFDIYSIKYEEVDEPIYITAVVIPETNKIITCYPSNKYISQFENDEIIEENVKVKTIKRKSQIEKFNERYKKIIVNKQ